jgi:hypothetical protein
VALEATPEPKLQWLITEGVKVEKAVDDQGQKLAQAAEARPDPDAPPPLPPRGAAFLPGIGLVPEGTVVVPLRLKKGEKEAKAIKELKGALTAKVLTSDRPYITVEDVAKAAGKTVKGGGGSIKVVDVKKGDNEQVTVRFEFDAPPGVQPTMNAAAGWGAGAMPAPGGPLPPPVAVPVAPPPPPAPAKRPALPPGALAAAEDPPPAAPPALKAPPPGRGGIAVGMPAFGMPGHAGYNGLTLQDEKGQYLPCTIVPQWRAPAAGAGRPQMEYALTFTPKKDVAARLVFSGRRLITVEVPFTLKDVAVP